MKKITIPELKHHLLRIPKADLLIADVRTIKEFNTLHIDNTQNIPLKDLAEKGREFWSFDTIITLSDNALDAQKACEIVEVVHPQNLFHIGVSFNEARKQNIRLLGSGGNI